MKEANGWITTDGKFFEEVDEASKHDSDLEFTRAVSGLNISGITYDQIIENKEALKEIFNELEL